MRLGELFRQVDGGGFQRARLDVASAANACAAHRERAGARPEAIDAAMLGDQAVDVAEGGQRDLVDAAGEAVGEDGGDEAVVIDVDGRERAERRAVDLRGAELRGRVIVGETAGAPGPPMSS